MKTGDILAKTAQFVNSRQRDIVLAACIILVAWSAYNLGRIQGRRTESVHITASADGNTAPIGQGNAPATASKPSRPLDARVVVSKSSSSKKYHYTWCSGASRIKEENKVWFETAAAAAAAGYSLAGNCN